MKLDAQMALAWWAPLSKCTTNIGNGNRTTGQTAGPKQKNLGLHLPRLANLHRASERAHHSTLFKLDRLN
jgi:hypothetical protein